MLKRIKQIKNPNKINKYKLKPKYKPEHNLKTQPHIQQIFRLILK